MARDVNEIRRNGSDCLAKGVPCEASDLVLDSIRIFSRLGGAEFIGFGECVGGDWRLYAVQAYPGVGDIGPRADAYLSENTGGRSAASGL